MKLEVTLTNQAKTEAEEAYLWIAQDSPNRAARWYNSLLDAIETLESFPRRCGVAPEDALFAREIRQLIHGNYRVLFTIEEDTVVVLHVRHGAREYLVPDDPGAD